MMKIEEKISTRQRIIEILVKPLKVPYQEDAAEMMVQGCINQAEEIQQLFEEERREIFKVIELEEPNAYARLEPHLSRFLKGE